MSFTLKIEPEAKIDIQEGINWYNKQQPGIGKKFHSAVKAQFNQLKINPFYRIRYDDVHCLSMRRYPYMIHFRINEKKQLIIVHAIINTSRDPDIWRNRT